MYGRRRKLTAEETAANTVRREARKQAAMTCQCCARKHLANGGVIAHHGYQRPYEGWQTASCMGARELPFEVDRDCLAVMIAALKRQKERMIVARAAIENETVELTLSYVVHAGYGKREEKSLKVTRATWDAVRAENLMIFSRHLWSSFDTRKSLALMIRDSKIRFIASDIAAQEKRYAGWKQTHKRENDQWVKL
jgi:hypothetical protein